MGKYVQPYVSQRADNLHVRKEFLEIKKTNDLLGGKKQNREESTEEMNLTLWKRCSTSVGASEAHLKRCQNAVSRLGRPTDIQTVGSTLARPCGNRHFYLLLEALWDEE